MAESRQYGDLILIRRLIGHARPFWVLIVAIALVSLLATPIALLGPIPLKIAVDSVLGGLPAPEPLETLAAGSDRTAWLLGAVALLLVGVALLRYGQGMLTWVLTTYTGQRMLLQFRSQLFAHVQRLSLAYHDSRGGDAVYRIQYDAPAIQHVLIDGLIPLVGAITTLAGIFLVTAAIDLELALIALVVAPVLFVLSRAYSRPLRRHWVRVHEMESSALSVVQEVLGAVRVVKAFGQEEREEGRFVDRSNEAVRAHLRVIAVEGAFMLFVGMVMAIGTAVVLYIGITHVQSGRISLGELLVVIAYLTMLYDPLKAVSTKTADLQASLAGAERAFRLLDEQPDVVERPNARPIDRAVGAIRVRDVSFGYGDGADVLHGVNLDVDPGTRVGISGRTGAGKSTLVNLLCRFYDPRSGEIQLDGVDLRDYRLADLRAQFSIVLQEPVLFPTSIGENIAYARPTASAAEIEAAARAANAHGFIMATPEGYDTEVGERGLRLSGGERQRISIARAFLRDAPILILDEPTSSVDAETEASIIDAMWRLMAGRTTFMIAHRISTLAACDRQIRVVDGEIVDWEPQESDWQLEPSSIRQTPLDWADVARRGGAVARQHALTQLLSRRGVTRRK